MIQFTHIIQILTLVDSNQQYLVQIKNLNAEVFYLTMKGF